MDTATVAVLPSVTSTLPIVRTVSSAVSVMSSCAVPEVSTPLKPPPVVPDTDSVSDSGSLYTSSPCRGIVVEPEV